MNAHSHQAIERRGLLARLALVALLGALFCADGLHAQDGPPGLTAPVILPPFAPSAENCGKPQELQRRLGFGQDNEREFVLGIRRGLELAAKDRGLEFVAALANNSPTRMKENIEAFRSSRTGAIVVAPIDPPGLTATIKQFIWTGGYVGMIVPPPATTILNAPQYLTGKVLADAAVDYIRTRLNGKAKVVLLTHDGLQFLAPRFTAMRDALRELPGVTIVADISPATVNKDGGRATMSTILLAQPTVDVVLGADTVVLGALEALRAEGKARADQFLGGIDGEPEAVAEIKKGGPYKASVSLASPIFGYALGQFAADWLDGGSIPQGLDILPRALTANNIAQYESDIANPATVFNDAQRRDSYLKMYGNICFDTRDQYLNFPWSSERR